MAADLQDLRHNVQTCLVTFKRFVGRFIELTTLDSSTIRTLQVRLSFI
jgi:hypothetical protein